MKTTRQHVFMVILRSKCRIFIEKLFLMGDARGVTVDDKQQPYLSQCNINLNNIHSYSPYYCLFNFSSFHVTYRTKHCCTKFDLYSLLTDTTEKSWYCKREEIFF